MAKIHSMLDMGRRGMAISQSAMQTASHNIANKGVEGFSRQRVDIETSPSAGDNKSRIGNGTYLASITRSSNPFIEKQIEKEGANFAYQEGKANSMQKLESVFNEQTVKGLSNSMSEFFNGFRELANNPESMAARTLVRDNANSMIKNFQDMDRQIASVHGELNSNIKLGVDEINSHVKEIAQLNEKISSTEIGVGIHANDERDRRDILLKKLAEKLDISYAEDAKTGMVNVTAGKTAILVAGSSHYGLKADTDINNKTQVRFQSNENSHSIDVTDQIRKGQIGSAIELRDGLVNELREGLSELSYNLANEVNNAHQEGFDRYNEVGVKFFDLPDDGTFDIEKLKINQAITRDVGRISAAAKENSPGDNTVANVIHSLQFKPMMGEKGTFTFDDFYNSKVGQVGILSQKAQAGVETQRNILDQLKNVREGISGVSLDEEAQKMIEYQKSFDSLARVIRMADEMFDTVLNLKRY